MSDYVPLRAEPTDQWWSERYIDDEELEEPKHTKPKFRNSDIVLEILSKGRLNDIKNYKSTMARNSNHEKARKNSH